MRKILCVTAFSLAALLWFSGCKKADEPAAGTPPPQLLHAGGFRPAFESATPEIKAAVDGVMMNIQSSMYPEALNGLAKLAADPTLTDPQKKAVADLTDQLQKKMAAMSAPSP